MGVGHGTAHSHRGSNSEPGGSVATSLHATDARIVRSWVREIGLDVSAYGTHTMRRTKGVTDLSANQESPSRPAFTGSYEARKHCAVPWDRGRRRSGDGGTDRGVDREPSASAAAGAERPRPVTRSLGARRAAAALYARHIVGGYAGRSSNSGTNVHPAPSE
jgi:hypothetical protein